MVRRAPRVLLHGLGERRLGRRGRGEVRGDGMDSLCRSSVGLHASSGGRTGVFFLGRGGTHSEDGLGLREPRDVPRDEGDVRAASDEGDGERSSEAGGAAGDVAYLAGQPRVQGEGPSPSPCRGARTGSWQSTGGRSRWRGGGRGDR